MTNGAAPAGSFVAIGKAWLVLFAASFSGVRLQEWGIVDGHLKAAEYLGWLRMCMTFEVLKIAKEICVDRNRV